MRFKKEGKMIRVFSNDYKIAYTIIGICGLQVEIEFPSD